MPHLSRPNARHLSRSRHGIWYVRWVVPVDLRERFPQLPRELKRSTGSANVRVARRCARDYLGQWLTTLNGHAAHMPPPPDSRLDAIFGLMKVPGARSPAAIERPNVAPLVIERDPATGNITRVETHPHDPPETLALANQILRQHLESPTAPKQPAASPVPMLDISPTGIASRWLGDAIVDYLEALKAKGGRDENTLRYSHGPSLTVFRELISDRRRLFGKGDAKDSWDIRLAHLKPERLDQFLKDFRRFPSRQGKRSGDAREVLASGGEAQSRSNRVKRLRHIQELLEWLTERHEVEEKVLGVLQAELKDMPSQKNVDSRQLLDTEDDADEHDGYVAFSSDELARLFNKEVFLAHTAGKAARFWIPLLGRYTGCRVNELAQACVQDIRLLDELPCLYVTPAESDAKGVPVPKGESKKRVKTRAAKRTIPLHQELIRLGFLDYLAERKEAGEKFLFDLTYFKKDGFGKDPSRDFQTLIKAVGVWRFKRKVFHSFRATINQNLEDAGLEAQLLDRYLGHSVNTVRKLSYGRNDKRKTLPIRLVYEALCKVLTADTADLPPWSVARNAPAKRLGPICERLGFA